MFRNTLAYLALAIAIYILPIRDIKLLAYVTILFLIIFNLIMYYKRLPPGPWGVPLLGYLPFILNQPPHSFYLKMTERYGDVFSVKLGSNLIVCIGNTKLVKELFNRSDSTGRPHTPLANLLGGMGIILSEGALWKKQRQFLHERFRNLGVKLYPNRFEKTIMSEIEELLVNLKETQGQSLNPVKIFGRHIHNVICQLMMSFRFTENDQEFVMFNERVSRGMMLFGSVLIGEHVEAYLRLPGKQKVINEIKRNLVDISKFHRDHVMERIKSRSMSAESSPPRDLLDHYLEKIESVNSDPKADIFPGVDQVSQIVQVMNDLFSAGTDTSMTTLLWMLVIMMREPGVAERVRAELRTVVRKGQQVTLEHRLSLPYVEAVVFETMRMQSIVPLGTTHVNTSDWKIGDFTIPAGTQIIPLINKMNQDPELYIEPETFKPERFVKDGKLHITDNYMAFGVGQRMCIGNLLARMELFLFFSNIMNNFHFYMPQGEAVPSLNGNLGTTHAPSSFNICFEKLKN